MYIIPQGGEPIIPQGGEPSNPQQTPPQIPQPEPQIPQPEPQAPLPQQQPQDGVDLSGLEAKLAEQQKVIDSLMQEKATRDADAARRAEAQAIVDELSVVEGLNIGFDMNKTLQAMAADQDESKRGKYLGAKGVVQYWNDHLRNNPNNTPAPKANPYADERMKALKEKVAGGTPLSDDERVEYYKLLRGEK